MLSGGWEFGYAKESRGGNMDIVELCKLQVAAFSRVEWNLEGLIEQAKSQGLHVIEKIVSKSDSRYLRVSLSNESGIRWNVILFGSEFSGLRVNLKKDLATYLISDEDYEAKLDEFARDYRLLERTVRELLGQEIFAGAYGAKGFPRDYPANYLTRWQIANGYLMLSYEEHKRGDPLILSLVTTPFRRENPT